MMIRTRVVILCLLAMFHAGLGIIDHDRDTAIVRVAFAMFCLVIAILTDMAGRSAR